MNEELVGGVEMETRAGTGVSKEKRKGGWGQIIERGQGKGRGNGEGEEEKQETSKRIKTKRNKNATIAKYKMEK